MLQYALFLSLYEVKRKFNQPQVTAHQAQVSRDLCLSSLVIHLGKNDDDFSFSNMNKCVWENLWFSFWFSIKFWLLSANRLSAEVLRIASFKFEIQIFVKCQSNGKMSRQQSGTCAWQTSELHRHTTSTGLLHGSKKSHQQKISGSDNTSMDQIST